MKEKLFNHILTLEMTKRYNIPIAKYVITPNPDKLIDLSLQLQYPLVLKGLAKDIVHKSDAGLVITNIKSEMALKDAVNTIVSRSSQVNIESYLLQEHIDGKREIIIGGTKHTEYGPCVYLGIGGIWVEAIEDVSFRSVPITIVDVQEMINELKCRKIFGSCRGEPPIDIHEIFHILQSVETLLHNEPEIYQFELNPILIVNDKPVAVDVRAVTYVDQFNFQKNNNIQFDIERFIQLFGPKSIALIGVTDSPLKWGFRVLFNTLEGGYKGRIYGVNPNKKEVLNIPCYPNVKSLPETVDLAVIIVPPPAVIPTIHDCIDKGIRVILVITAGFGELSDLEAKQAQERMKEIAIQNNMYLIGPNCAGLVSPEPMSLYCAMLGRHPKPGKLSVISQSGNVGNTIMSWAMEHQLGIARFISTGNEAVINSSHYLKFLGHDPKTEVIFSYIESAKNIYQFHQELKQVTKQKPVIILKGGKTQEGSRAATSHTGALATDYRLFKSICKQFGGIVVEDVYEGVEVAHLLSNVPLPKGRNVGILSQGGGWGVITADAFSNAGLNVIPLPETTLKNLDAIMPKWWNRTNPVDLVAGTDIELFSKALEIMIQTPEFDIIAILGIGYTASAIHRLQQSERAKSLGLDKLAEIGIQLELKDAEKIAELMKVYKKPVVIASDTTIFLRKTQVNQVLNNLEELGIYVFQNPSNMAKAVAHLCQYSEYLQNKPRT